MKIDKIYIISLNAGDPSVQRNIAAKVDHLGMPYSVGWEIVQGFDGTSGNLLDGHSVYNLWNLGSDSWNDWWKRDVTGGEAGCAISHLNIWKSIIKDDVNCALILEDDFVSVTPLTNPVIPNTEWDIAFLGRNAICPKDEKRIDVSNKWVTALSSYNTHAYVIKRDTAKTLVNDYNFQQNLIAPDEFLTATYTDHRRQDINILFPPKLKAIAPVNNWIEQNRPHEKSTTEPNDANINLLKKQPYFEILDDSDWDSWKSKYVNETVAKGEYDLMIDDIGNNIYEFPLFTEKFCKEAVALAEVMNKWTKDRHEFYPTNDVLLPEIGLDNIYNRVIKEIVSPLCIHLWELEGAGWDNMNTENFMVRYTTDRQSHLSLHHDFSHITMVVKLNDEFDGGGTWFPKYKILANPKLVGTATIHPGMITHKHGARPIHSGKRYINVSFMRKNN